MFIVVAIVIFGLFVVLANTLFGSEGLTSDLKGLFQNSTEQATLSLGENVPIYDYLMIHRGSVSNWKEYYDDNGGVITLSSKGETYIGIRTTPELLEPDSEYQVTYKIKKISGDITKLGGHLSVSNDTKLWFDGEPVVNNGRPTTIRYTFDYPNDNEEHTVKTTFNTYDWEDSYVLENTFLFRSFYIQPNHLEWEKEYVVDVYDIELTKL